MRLLHECNINILNSLPVIVFWQDLRGRYLGCNQQIVDMIGRPGQSIIGQTDQDLAWSKAAAQLQALDQLVIGGKIKREIEIRGANGHAYLLVKTPWFDDQGQQVIGMTGVATDISNQEDDKKIVHALRILSNGIAHDMRTPISAININIENLQHELNKFPPNALVSKFISNMRFALSSCSKFIDMLTTKLHLILKEQNQYYKFTQNSIKHDINEALQEYNFFGAERTYVQWDDQANQDFVYMGNSLLTKHVIFNLLKNSLKAFKEADQDSASDKIFINLAYDQGFNCIIFKDTATGIDSNVFDNLFDKFNGSKDSAGLGLAFCKMVMHSYGGDITCNSRFGNYTEFTLKFPVLNKLG